MKTAFFCLLTLLLGLSIGLMINVHVVGETLFSQAGSTDGIPQTVQPTFETQMNPANQNTDNTSDVAQVKEPRAEMDSSNKILLDQAYAVLEALRTQNYLALSHLVHPTKGVTFTPYSTVDSNADRTLLPLEIAEAKTSNTRYIWGLWDGNGAPIQFSITEYFKNFVYNADFENAPMIGINTVLSSGNSLENVASAYPDASFVEFYFPGINQEYQGFDWRGLKLAFEPIDGQYKLVGVIHSKWTA